MKTDHKDIGNLDIGNKKIVIYGVGRIFERYKEYLNWENVVAIVDIDVNKQAESIYQRIIETPERIISLKYDYVVIFTSQSFENAKMNLIGNFFVEEEKIVSWRFLFDIYKIDENVVSERKMFYKQCLKEKPYCNVIDIGEQHMMKALLTREAFMSNMDNIGKNLFKLHCGFYRNCYRDYREVKREYDVTLLWGDFEKEIAWNQVINLTQEMIIWTVSYNYILHKNYAETIERLKKYGEKKTFLFSDAIVHLFKKDRDVLKLDCKIFVVTHKKYNVLNDDLYQPICVGNQYKNRNFQIEREGVNIASLNEILNECTALYWVWKNTDSQFIGLNHYRRFFYNNEIRNYANYLTKERITEIFESGYDIILPELTRLSVSVLDNIIRSIGSELANRALEMIRCLIRERVPQYTAAFEYVMSGKEFYKCQMFISGRKLFDTYCEWLFSFLIDAAKALDVSLCDAHHKRTIGYFAETLLTVWLLEENVKVKELPITEIK